MKVAPVIFFDGVCNLCVGAVQFVLKRDKKNIFRFASLQGKSGQEMMKAHQLGDHHYKTFIIEENGKLYFRSTAALKVFKLLGGAWSLVYAFIIIPAFIRDAIYNFISDNRYKWFGKKEVCWLPKEEWTSKFIP